MRKVFIIAEAGVSHNGSVELTKKMVDALKKTRTIKKFDIQ